MVGVRAVVKARARLRQNAMKTQYFTACTLDGFIADENNSLDWLFEAPHSPEHTFWEDWLPGIGGMVWGATTYEGHLERNGLGADSWREYFGERPCWNLHAPRAPPRAGHSDESSSRGT